MRNVKLFGFFLAFALLSCAVSAIPGGHYNFKAQKRFIPADLGQVYIGMPFKEFAKKIDISKAEADTRFDYINLDVPFQKGSITGLGVRIAGVPREQIKAMSFTETQKKSADGYKFETEIERIDPSKIGDNGFVYAFYVGFDGDFDLRAWALKAFGKDPLFREPDDEYYFYDIQWNKKTSDGLDWLVRVFTKDDKSLQLLGRIPGTEWAID